MTVALDGGRWIVTRGGVWTWLPDPRPAPKFCGTERGYQWHRHNDRSNWPLPPDDPCGCRAAHAAWRHFKIQMKRESECGVTTNQAQPHGFRADFSGQKWENWGTNSNEPQPRNWRSATEALTDQTLEGVIG